MMPPTIGDYYRAARAKTEIESTPDVQAIGMDSDEWNEYLIRKWSMSEIVLDESRQVEMSEGQRKHRLRGYDIWTNQEPGTVVQQAAVRVEVPVTPNDTLQVIWRQKLAPNTFSISHGYPPLDYDHNGGVLTDIVQPQQSEVKSAIDRIKAAVRAR
jgi:hypothetical protein